MSRKIGITIEPGTLLWIPDVKTSKKVFCLAQVLAVDEFSATVRTEGDGDKRLETINLETHPIYLANPTVEPDMTALHYIHEPGILCNLAQRSFKSEPYTFMGSVLVSVNPLRSIPNPTTVGTRQVLSGDPHPYAVAESAFQQMTFQGGRELATKGGSIRKASQSIVIGGESGAGKTESSKMVLQHLVNRQTGNGKGGMDGLDKRLLGTNPILEAFGNATTLRNPNSSRFGKMLRLHFDPPPNGPKGADEDWKLIGATVQSYLLERSRVTSHEQGERGYHIMYYVIAGSKAKSSEDLAGLSLDKGAKGFRYTTPEHPKLDESHDVKYIDELVQAMAAIGLSGQERKMVFEIVAGILHMGNIQFGEQDSNEGPRATVSAAQDLTLTASLLGVDEALLSRTFCERRFTVAGSEMVAPRNAKAAGFARDAIAKALYSGLFDWIMKKIDIALGGAGTNPEKTCSIGVLDIFGFETFAINGFEQLLINYTNEALQGTFNSQIFIAEAALYQKEGLFGTDDYMGRPLDNGICIELLQGNPSVKGKEHGILMTIDSEGRVPDPSDSKLNQRLHTNFASHPCMIKPHQKDKAHTFIIRHYAATVTYTVGAFLEKNNDRLPDDMETTLRTSSKSTVREIFPQEEAPPAAPPPPANGKKPPAPGRKPPARSIVHKFQAQIKALVDDLESTKCSFIRCVKPNAAMIRDDSDPSWFDEKYVKLQLDALNIAQTAEVLRNGFPTRIDYSTLVDQYVSLMPERALKTWKKTSDSRAFVRALFYAFGIDEDSFKLGFTKVFFKGGKLAELNSVMKTSQLSDEIIKKFLYYLARVRWRKAYAVVRGQIGFQKLYEMSHSKSILAYKIQSLYRIRRDRKRFKDLQRGARMAQKLWRGKQGRRVFTKMQAQLLADSIKRAEEARAKKDREAIAQAERLEREQREAQAKRDRDAEEKAAQVAVALEKQKEELERLKEEQEDAALEASLWAAGAEDAKGRRRTTIAVRGKKSRKTVIVRQGGALRPQMFFQPPKPPPPPMVVPAKKEQSAPEPEIVVPPPPRLFQSATKQPKSKQSDEAPPPPETPPPPSSDDEEAAANVKKKKNHRPKSQKRGSFFDFIAAKQESDFRIPCTGYCFYRDDGNNGFSGFGSPSSTDKRKSGALKLLTRMLSGKPKWVRAYYVMTKPDRSIVLYQDITKKSVIREIKLHQNVKVWKYEDDRRKPYGIEVEDGSRQFYFAFETETLWRRWMKDAHEAIHGFKPAVPTAKEAKAINLEPVDLHIVAQLNFLLFRDMISQDEFNDLVQRAAAHEKLKLQKKEEEEEYEREQESLKLPPLKNPVGSNLAYHGGRLSFGSMCIERNIDFTSFEERLSLNCSVRFHLDNPVHRNKEIGWTISRPFQEYRAMHLLISDPDGPLTPESRLALPPFPHFAFSNSVKFINKATQEHQAKNLEEWLKKLLSSIPYVEADLYLDELPPPPPIVDPATDPTNWRTVTDPDTGDKFYHNKITGETRFQDPFKGRDDVCIQEEFLEGLPENWEATKDEESGQTYYYNVVTEETTWDRPSASKPSIEEDEAAEALRYLKEQEKKRAEQKNQVKKFEIKDFLRIPAVEEFFDIKGNVESLVESIKARSA